MASVSATPKFFITHSWKDIAFARRLADDLNTFGLQGFFDDHSISAGDNIAARINKGLSECDIYMPILSYAALESPWCEEEITTAITLSKIKGRQGRPRIIPLLIEDCQDKIEEMLPSLLARLYIDFVGRYEEALADLLEKGFGLSHEMIQANGSARAVSAAVAGREHRDNVRAAQEHSERAPAVPEQTSTTPVALPRPRSGIWSLLLLVEFVWILAVAIIGTVAGQDRLTDLDIGAGLALLVAAATFLRARSALPIGQDRTLLIGLGGGMVVQYLAIWLFGPTIDDLVYEIVTPGLDLGDTQSQAVVLTLASGFFAILGGVIGAIVIAWQLRDAKGDERAPD